MPAFPGARLATAALPEPLALSPRILNTGTTEGVNIQVPNKGTILSIRAGSEKVGRSDNWEVNRLTNQVFPVPRSVPNTAGTKHIVSRQFVISNV